MTRPRLLGAQHEHHELMPGGGLAAPEVPRVSTGYHVVLRGGPDLGGVVGIVEQFDASVVAVAGWDPRSSSQTFPAATGMFVEKLSEARIELINQAG